MKLILESSLKVKKIPRVLVNDEVFSEIIIENEEENKYPNYGFCLNQSYLRLIYRWLIDNNYIEWIEWDYFRYFFEGKPCDDNIRQIVWLKKSKESIGVLLEEMHKLLKSKHRTLSAEQKQRIKTITPMIFVDAKGKPCQFYKKSGTESRVDAENLETFLASIQEFANIY